MFLSFSISPKSFESVFSAPYKSQPPPSQCSSSNSLKASFRKRYESNPSAHLPVIKTYNSWHPSLSLSSLLPPRSALVLSFVRFFLLAPSSASSSSSSQRPRRFPVWPPAYFILCTAITLSRFHGFRLALDEGWREKGVEGYLSCCQRCYPNVFKILLDAFLCSMNQPSESG